MRVRIGIWLAGLGLVLGCQVSYVSHYDEATDRGVMELHGVIDAHLARLDALAAEPPGLEALARQCDPVQFDESYSGLRTRLRALLVRNQARERNDLTVAQLEALGASLETLRQQQQERFAPGDGSRAIARPGDRCLGTGQLQANRQILEQHVRAILKLELAKRDFRAQE